ATAAGQTLEQVAPDNTVFAFGVRNLSEAMKAFGHNPMLGGLEDAEDDDIAAGLIELLPEDLRDAVGGAAGGPAVSLPTGAVGLAIYATMNQELGVPEPAFMFLADFGEGIDGITQRINHVVDNADDENRMITTRKVEGRTVWSIEVPDIDPGDLADMEDEDVFGGADDPFGGMMPAPGDLFQIDTIHLVQAGTALIASSDLGSLTNGLKSVDGNSNRNLANNKTFQKVVSQVGGTDAYTVVLTGDMMQLVGALDPMGMMQMFAPMVRSTFGDIHGFGYGVDMANDGMTQKFAVLMPNGKQGLPSLLATPLERSAPPAFVGGGVSSYAAMSVDFPKVVGVIDNVIKGNPMLGMQMGPSWNGMKEALSPIFDSLGTEMHMVTPGSADVVSGAEPVMIVDCAEPDQLVGMLDAMAAGGAMKGSEVGEHSVFSFDLMGGMMGGGLGAVEEIAEEESPAIGVTDTHVLFGGQGELKKLIAAGASEKPLKNDLLFDRARGTLPERPIVAWGYSDLSKLFDFSGMLGEVMGEEAAEMVSTDEMGAMVWYIESSEMGFVGSIRELPAAQAVNAAERD
ncbi:MAG: hypothetical protein ACYTF9_13715, partial [Planctomycetota bacterium]